MLENLGPRLEGPRPYMYVDRGQKAGASYKTMRVARVSPKRAAKRRSHRKTSWAREASGRTMKSTRGAKAANNPWKRSMRSVESHAGGHQLARVSFVTV